MKRTKEGDVDIEYTKSNLSITKAKRLFDGTRIEIGTVNYEDESICNHDYEELDGDEIVAPWPIQTRGQASGLGQRKYYTGTLCRQQHMSQRYVCSGMCIKCVSVKSKGFKKNVDAAKRGLVSVMIHPDDKQAVEDYAALIASQRGL